LFLIGGSKMAAHTSCRQVVVIQLALTLLFVGGCQSPRRHLSEPHASVPTKAFNEARVPGQDSFNIQQHTTAKESAEAEIVLASAPIIANAPEAIEVSAAPPELQHLIEQALAANPLVGQLEAEAAAAWARVPQVRALPDPMASGTVFGEPMHMVDGRMRGTLMFNQTIPSLKQLSAQGQEAAFEALMLQQEVEAARLSIAADVAEAWYRLYLLGQLMRINEANRQLISPLVDVATGRVEVGETSPGDVVLGTLELSRTEEERLMLEQQLSSRTAALNRLLDRPADTPVSIPENIDQGPADYTLDELREMAFEQQPEIIGLRLRTQATAWGVRVARLERIPEVDLNYEHMFMTSNPGADANDPWRVGVAINVPLWHSKYRAIEREAQQENLAARRQVDGVMREYDARLLDLLAQARAAARTAKLYRETILPQARQALEVDQRAYGQGTVTFERVVEDARNLLVAEAAYYRAIVEQAIAVARIQEAVGGQLPASTKELRIQDSLPAPPAE
jgi:outer membrane protein TolC